MLGLVSQHLNYYTALPIGVCREAVPHERSASPTDMPSCAYAALSSWLCLGCAFAFDSFISPLPKTTDSLNYNMECQKLTAKFPTLVYLPQTQEYQNSTQSYFAAFENELQPACVLAPKTTQDVASIIKYLSTTPQSFKVAVRGRGHTPWAGAANIDEAGVTIDLRQLKGVSVGKDDVVKIGGGETWATVYSTLEAKGLAVVGGRVSKVGVSGLTIGGMYNISSIRAVVDIDHETNPGLGGLSYFSAKTGFVCDNVINFEVVLSTGEIVQANRTSNVDLFRALKGGTNNFGIITRIDFPAFQQGKMWGGAAYYLPTAYSDIVQAFSSFAKSTMPDGDAHVIVATAYSPAGAVNVVNVYHAKPTPNPPSLAPFVTIETPLMTTLREDSLLGFAREQANFSTDGARQLFFTTTVKVDQQLLLDLKNLFDATIQSINNIPGLTLSMVFQPVTKELLQSSAARGPNVLGLSLGDGPFAICLLNSVHENASDDATIMNAVTKLQEKIEDLAKSRGLGVRYRFLNYAYKNTKAIESYGPENVEFLRTVAVKYDPTRFFHNKVPGGFKLP